MAKYNKALDHILAAALSFKAGSFEQAAVHMEQAAEDDGFDEAVDMIDGTNEEALEDDALAACGDGADGDDGQSKAVAAFTRAGRRLAAGTEDLGDGDLPNSDSKPDDDSKDDAVLRGEDAVAARLSRVTANKRTLKRLK